MVEVYPHSCRLNPPDGDRQLLEEAAELVEVLGGCGLVVDLDGQPVRDCRVEDPVDEPCGNSMVLCGGGEPRGLS